MYTCNCCFIYIYIVFIVFLHLFYLYCKLFEFCKGEWLPINKNKNVIILIFFSITGMQSDLNHSPPSFDPHHNPVRWEAKYVTILRSFSELPWQGKETSFISQIIIWHWPLYHINSLKNTQNPFWKAGLFFNFSEMQNID